MRLQNKTIGHNLVLKVVEIQRNTIQCSNYAAKMADNSTEGFQ